MDKRVDDANFIMAVKDWNDNKRKMDSLKAENAKIENYILEKFSDVDLTTDAKGTERIMSEDGEFCMVLEHKLNVSVDMEQAKSMLEATGKAPEHFFNVKYDYSATMEKTMNEEDKAWLAGCLSCKRAKTSFKVAKIKEN